MSQAIDRAAMCRAHAEQCRAEAELARSEAARSDFLKLSKQWDTLAQEIEAIEKMRVFTADASDHRKYSA
jgi:hypothetical protein